MNISIISACNNNCEYCFQKEYHAQNKMLTYEEIEEILEWGKTEARVGILGGEPTLHPDIVKILRRATELTETCVYTNLLCKPDLLKELIKIKDVKYLVNTTSRDELKDLFYNNIEFLYSQKEYLKKSEIYFSFGLTLMNDEKIDNEHIENMFKLIDAFPGFTSHVRMGLATPFHEGTFDLMNYEKPVRYMIEKTLKDYPDMTIGFDCPSNNCQIPARFMGEILEQDKVNNFQLSCLGPIFDVLVDKSIKYCFSFPDDFMRIDHYSRFKNSAEVRRWYDIKIFEYMSRYSYQCRSSKICKNNICKGPCPAVNEYLRRQNQSQV